MHSQKESNKIETLKKNTKWRKNSERTKACDSPKKRSDKTITEWKYDNRLKNDNNKNVNAVNNNYIMQYMTNNEIKSE